MKLLFLYDTIKHPQLMTTVCTLQVGQISGNTVSFTDSCGFLATMVSKFPESQIKKQNVSFVEGYCGRKWGHAKVPNDLVGIRTGDGEIYTGYYADFFQLSKANQAAVQGERKQVGQTVKVRGKNSKMPAGMSVKAIKAMKAQIKAQIITISVMRAKFGVETEDYSFGCHKEKNKSKKAKTKHDDDEEWLAPLLWFWINSWDWILYFIRDRGGAMKPWRRICDFTTSLQRIAKVKANGPTSRIIGATNTIKHGRLELDTHADTIVFG